MADQAAKRGPTAVRPLEIALLLLTFAAVCDLLRVNASRERPVLAGLALIAMIGQIALEQARWQLYPIYFLVTMLLYLASRTHADHEHYKVMRRIFVGLGLAAVVVCAFLAYALPVPVIPAPPGPYKVGTATWQFTDTSRTDPYAPEPNTPRIIVLQAWYPAEVAPGMVPAAWCPSVDIFGPAIAKKFGLPSFLLNHLQLVQSHAYANAEVKAQPGGWPVVIYSHGWTGFRNIAVDEAEALASQGYVVFAPDHLYGALATVLKDGTPVLNNPKAMPPDEPKDARQIGIELLVDTYAGDLRYVLDTVEKMNAGEKESPFKDKLDVAKIGLYGHSTGGGAVYEVAATDPRVKAVFGYDTWTEPISPEVRAKPLTIPFFSLRSAQWAERDDAKAKILRELIAQSKAPVYDYYVKDSKHADFTLMPILSPFAGTLGMTGPIDGRRVLEIGDDYLTAFFGQYLLGKESPLMNGESKDFPEVKKVE